MNDNHDRNIQKNEQHYRQELERCGQIDDLHINPATYALYISGLLHPGLSLKRYFTHLDKLAQQAREHYTLLCEANEESVQLRIQTLKHVMTEKQDYSGDTENYDDLQNADLVRVIDRRKGMPIALAILSIHIGRALGWDIYGVNVPGHFLVRLDYAHERIIIDPFHDFKIVDAAALRKIVKQHVGPDAEVSAAYYEAAGNRDVLVRLMNNHKFRLIEQEEYKRALDIIQIMRLFAPNEIKLLFEEGIISARVGHHFAALTALESYVDLEQDALERAEAEALIADIRNMMN